MNFSLIICTYQRSESVLELLQSVEEQSLYPNQILIVDGSEDDNTKFLIQKNPFSHLEYFKVPAEHRGLTKQRNFGISKVGEDIGIVCFLDDDTVLLPKYFSEILKTYKKFPEALGVSGYITNEIKWTKDTNFYKPQKGEFMYDGWMRIEGSRFSLRRKFGLAPDVPPGFMPDFSHGYSAGFLPPSGKTYKVEFFMGCAMSFKVEVINKIKFSTYFEGYGLYEDMDFCLRVAQQGSLFLNTLAELEHHHAAEGRPNKFKYGKMVLRNGWYVWRVKYPNPTLKVRFKWHATAFLLTLVRLGNVLNTNQKKEALTEGLGRIAGWWGLVFKRSKI